MSNSSHILLLSKDGYELYVEREVVPKNIPCELPYDHLIVEKLAEYMYSKHYNQIGLN